MNQKTVDELCDEFVGICRDCLPESDHPMVHGMVRFVEMVRAAHHVEMEIVRATGAVGIIRAALGSRR